jgi:hypothetical protein
VRSTEGFEGRYGHPGFAAQSRPSIVGSIPQAFTPWSISHPSSFPFGAEGDTSCYGALPTARTKKVYPSSPRQQWLDPSDREVGGGSSWRLRCSQLARGRGAARFSMRFGYPCKARTGG